MANIFEANWVVFHNEGQYLEDQKDYFITEKEANTFVENFFIKHPFGGCFIKKWDNERRFAICNYCGGELYNCSC